MKRLSKQKVFIAIIAVITLTLLFFFMKNIIFEIIKLQIQNKPNEVKLLLEEQGWFGFLAVVLIEGLQMVVVFISAEFIQISAGISYPWYMAIALCSIGIFLGASIIYMLCNLTKFDATMFDKHNKKIKSFSRHKQNVQILMYILFIMPVVPFGAVCYYGSNSKISYRRYIFTCLTGTIPSIISSIFLGRFITFAIIKDMPWWALLLIILAVVLVLFALCALVLSLTVFKQNKNTPDSPIYNILLKVFKFRARKIKYIKDDINKLNIEGPYLILSNHPSGLDVYYTTELAKPSRLGFILNYYFFRFKAARFFLKRIGVIPKKLFTPDIKTVKGTLRMVKNGYPVYMCPEGRLGLDGTNYYITKETGKFAKQLKLPIVIVTLKGAYISKPKWRKTRIKSIVESKITRYLTKEEVLEKSGEEINQIINESIAYNEFEYIKEKGLTFKHKKKAEGLENVLYYCPKCHQEFTIETKGNKVYCEHCGFSLDIKEDYHFEDNEFNIHTIHDWYELIKQYENKKLDNVYLETEVEIRKFNIENKKLDEVGTGKCILTNHSFKYIGDLNVKEFEIEIANLRALAFSAGEEFECYHNNELYYFYPKTNRKQCVKWALIVDELVKGVDLGEEE